MKKNKSKTGIEYIRGIYDKENKCPLVFEAAEMLQVQIIKDFSMWLGDEGWVMRHTGFWGNELMNEDCVNLGTLYIHFLKCRNK